VPFGALPLRGHHPSGCDDGVREIDNWRFRSKVEIVGFRSPKSKNQDGGTVLGDTGVSGRRSETMKEGRDVAPVGRAMPHGRTTLARVDHATQHGHAAFPI